MLCNGFHPLHDERGPANNLHEIDDDVFDVRVMVAATIFHRALTTMKGVLARGEEGGSARSDGVTGTGLAAPVLAERAGVGAVQPRTLGR